MFPFPVSCLAMYRLFPADPGVSVTAFISGLHAAHPGGWSASRPGDSGARHAGSFWECQLGHVHHHRQVWTPNEPPSSMLHLKMYVLAIPVYEKEHCGKCKTQEAVLNPMPLPDSFDVATTANRKYYLIQFDFWRPASVTKLGDLQ